MIFWDTPLMGGLMGGSSGIIKYQINFDFIEIIQFCLFVIYDWLWYLHVHITHWGQSLGIEIISMIHSLALWLFDNWHIMHHCQFWAFFWHLTYYLNHLTGVQGYFLLIWDSPVSWGGSRWVECPPHAYTCTHVFWAPPYSPPWLLCDSRQALPSLATDIKVLTQCAAYANDSPWGHH